MGGVWRGGKRGEGLGRREIKAWPRVESKGLSTRILIFLKNVYVLLHGTVFNSQNYTNTDNYSAMYCKHACALSDDYVITFHSTTTRFQTHLFSVSGNSVYMWMEIRKGGNMRFQKHLDACGRSLKKKSWTYSLF